MPQGQFEGPNAALIHTHTRPLLANLVQLNQLFRSRTNRFAGNEQYTPRALDTASAPECNSAVSCSGTLLCLIGTNSAPGAWSARMTSFARRALLSMHIARLF